MIMKYTKVRNVKDPKRANPGDAGTDLFVPDFTQKFINDLKRLNPRIYVLYEARINGYNDEYFEPVIVLPPHERVLIPSGIHVNLPKNHKLQAANKSGIATNFGLDKMAELVDESYQGEIHISVANTSNELILIRERMKIIQFVLTQYNPVNWELVPDTTELYPEVSERGEGGFGSTGN